MKIQHLFISSLLVFFCFSEGYSQSALVRKAGKELIESLSEWSGKAGKHELAELIADEGGEAALKELAEKVVKEGGEESFEKMLRLTKRNGTDVLRAIRNASDPTTVIRVLDEIPEDILLPASRRLAAGNQGKALAKLIEAAPIHGKNMLIAEVKHPGIGAMFVSKMGTPGFVMANRVSTSALATFSSHADDIAKLSKHQRDALLNLMGKKYEQMEAFIAQFVRDHPGKTLFTAASTTVILANSDQIFGKDIIVYDEDGNIKEIQHRPGLLERLFEKTLKKPIQAAVFAVVSILLIASIIWTMWRFSLYRFLRKPKAQKNPSA